MPSRILLAIAVTEVDARHTLGARAQQQELHAQLRRWSGIASSRSGLIGSWAAAGRLMLDPTGKPAPRLRASVLRELEGRLQRLQELEHWIKERWRGQP